MVIVDFSFWEMIIHFMHPWFSPGFEVFHTHDYGIGSQLKMEYSFDNLISILEILYFYFLMVLMNVSMKNLLFQKQKYVKWPDKISLVNK